MIYSILRFIIDIIQILAGWFSSLIELLDLNPELLD
jgi:hypothetical protein